MSSAARAGTALLLAVALLAIGCTKEPQIRNVIVVSLDTLGAKRVGAYGYERDTTPNLDRLATEGTLFENAYTPQVWTMSAHISMMTGLYPLAHGAARKRASSPAATALPEVLGEAGFTTGAFLGAAGYADKTFGLGRGFDAYMTGLMNAEYDNKKLFKWLDKQAELQKKDPGHRFFALAHWYDVHSELRGDLPYTAPEPYRLRYLPEGLDWPRKGASKLLQKLEEDGTTEQDRHVISGLHDGGIRFTDEEALGALVEKLEELGLLDETLLVITSDHGEEIFEHGAALHSQPYEETARVPLILYGPGIPRGRRVPQLVELIDIMPTVLSLLGLPTPEHVQGHDLTPLLRDGGSIPREQAYVSGLFGAVEPFLMHKQSKIVRDVDGVRWAYVNTVHHDGDEGTRSFETRTPGELYRLNDDPDQRKNVAADHPELARELEQALLAWYAENDSLAGKLGQRKSWGKAKLTKKQRERLKALGYAQ